jgi:hypothetical protein
LAVLALTFIALLTAKAGFNQLPKTFDTFDTFLQAVLAESSLSMVNLFQNIVCIITENIQRSPQIQERIPNHTGIPFTRPMYMKPGRPIGWRVESKTVQSSN